MLDPSALHSTTSPGKQEGGKNAEGGHCCLQARTQTAPTRLNLKKLLWHTGKKKTHQHQGKHGALWRSVPPGLRVVPRLQPLHPQHRAPGAPGWHRQGSGPLMPNCTAFVRRFLANLVLVRLHVPGRAAAAVFRELRHAGCGGPGRHHHPTAHRAGARFYTKVALHLRFLLGPLAHACTPCVFSAERTLSDTRRTAGDTRAGACVRQYVMVRKPGVMVGHMVGRPPMAYSAFQALEESVSSPRGASNR